MRMGQGHLENILFPYGFVLTGIKLPIIHYDNLPLEFNFYEESKLPLTEFKEKNCKYF